MATKLIHQRAPLIGSRTDEGYAKKPNEDTCELFKVGSEPWTKDPGNSVYVGLVADGVTSKAGGEQASQLATATIKKALRRHAPAHLAAQPQQLIGEAIHQANREILEVARQNPEWGSMSTTLVLAAIANGQLTVAHLGDSRAYLLRQGQLHRLTLDHTWIQEALDLGRIEPAEALTHPNRNVIRRYLGINATVDIDWAMIHPNGQGTAQTRELTTTLTLQPDDVVLLCSDGLTEKVSDDEILAVLNRHKGTPDKAADLLVKRALAKKESDNITVVLLSYARRSGLGVWGKWLWVPLLLLLGILFFLFRSTLGGLLPATNPVGTAVAIAAEATVTTAPTVLPATMTPLPPTVGETVVAPTVMASPVARVATVQARSTVSATVGGEMGVLGPTPTRNQPTPTREIADTPTVAPSPTAAATSVVTNAIKPIQTSSSDPIANKQVKLVEPTASSGTGRIKFRWESNFNLNLGEAFELIFWENGQDPIVNGLGFGRSSPDSEVIVDCDAVEKCKSGVTYCSGVLLVNQEPYTRKAFLSDPNQCQEFRFDSSGGRGGNSCTLTNSQGECSN